MNFFLISLISKKFAKSQDKSNFLNFARVVAFCSVMLGSIALIISFSVLEGFDSKLRENAVKFTAHITINSINRKPLPNYPEILKNLPLSIPEIKAIAPIIEREGLIRSKSFIEGIMIRGIKKGFDITGINKIIISGKFGFTSENSKEIIIGNRLAKRLKAKIGDELILYSARNTSENTLISPGIDNFKITGIYETGMAKYDDIVVFIPFETATGIFRLPENSTISYEVMLNDVNKAPETAVKIEDFLGFPYFCYNVFELHSAIFAWIELQKEPIPLVLGLISIVAIFNIITILLISVVEKTRHIGILRAVGMNGKSLLSIFVMQGLTIGLAGTITGCILALILCLIQQETGLIKLQGNIYFLDTLPIKISYIHYLVVIGTSAFLSFIATFAPAFAALRIKPIEAIRFK